MKTTELQIGDWVYDKVLKSNARVEALQPLTIKCDIHTQKHICDEFEPVKLTPEILEKNGFVNDSSYDECVADGHFITIQIWSYNTENVLIQWDGITCEVINDFGNPCEKITLHGENYEHDIYVHELQHALRLCGLDELATNFKI